jgi:hypothetical protein
VELAVQFDRMWENGRVMVYPQQAAENALQRHAYQQGIDHLSQGLSVPARLPESRKLAQQALEQIIAFVHQHLG